MSYELDRQNGNLTFAGSTMKGGIATTIIGALARKLLIALWRLVTTGEVPDGVELRPAA